MKNTRIRNPALTYTIYSKDKDLFKKDARTYYSSVIMRAFIFAGKTNKYYKKKLNTFIHEFLLTNFAVL